MAFSINVDDKRLTIQRWVTGKNRWLILGFENMPQVVIASPTKLLAVPDLGV
jgi:hypothetical protein